jgi:multidrug efflux pump subunit AcrB
LALFIIKTKKSDKKDTEENKPDYMEKLNIWYNKVLVNILKRKKRFLLIILLLFIGSVLMLTTRPFKLVPDSDRNLVTIDINYPVGTKIEVTEAGVSQIEKYILDTLLVEDKKGERGVLDFSTYIGIGPEPYDLGYFKDEPNSNYAHLLLNTTGDVDNDWVIERLSDYCDTTIAVADIRVNRLSGAGATSTPVEIRVFGENTDSLVSITSRIKNKLREMPGTQVITDDLGPKIKKVVVDINEIAARRSGLTNSEIAVALQTGLSGIRVGDYREGEKSIPIFLKSNSDKEHTIESLQSLMVYSQSMSKSVPLQQVAQVKIEWQYGKYIHQNLEQAVTVGTYLKPGFTASNIFKSISPWLNKESSNWEQGYRYEFGGEDENTSENLSAIAAMLPVSAFLIVILLVIQFNSFRRTIIIVLTIPLGLIGVVFGWVVAGSTVSFFGVLGVIALAGILINDSIVLLDRIEVEQNINKDLSTQDAIIGAANHKFRPVLLTTLTTSLGMLPLWFGGGVLWQPLSVAIIFGLFFATVIILLFVPVVYSSFFNVDFSNYKLKKLSHH